MRKVAIIAAMHGNETYGIELYDAFVKDYPGLAQYVRLIIGNGKAHGANVRYIDADMNRQYGSTSESYEQGEIIRVDKELQEFSPDLIIDVHTTKRDSGIFFISDKPNKTTRPIFNMLDIDVCVMKDDVIKSSLIGRYSNAVSLEYSTRAISNVTTHDFIKSLAELVQESIVKTNSSQIYTVTNLITKKEWSNYPGLRSYDSKPEGVALMVPADISEVGAEYFGFWCTSSTPL